MRHYICAALCAALLAGCADSSPPPTASNPPKAQASSPSKSNSPAPATVSHVAVTPVSVTEDLPTAPCLAEERWVGPLEDAYNRVDPTQDGWLTEAFNDAAGKQLSALTKILEHPADATAQQLAAVATENIEFTTLANPDTKEVFQEPGLRVLRAEDATDKSRGLEQLAASIAAMGERLGTEAEHAHIKFKLYLIEPGEKETRTLIDFQADARGKSEARQLNSLWDCQWDTGTGAPRLKSIHIRNYEEVIHDGPAGTMFADCTQDVLGGTVAWREFLRHGADYWRARLPRSLGLDIVANHGLALGDVNGDGLEDIYVCTEGGLPNRLLLRNPDGTLRDAPQAGGADWIDYSASALLVDLDNDGDRDLVVAHEWRVILMTNDGQGRFDTATVVESEAQVFSMAAADYDQDGDLDLYCCGYNPSESTFNRGPLGAPMPFHDANNGGRNMLLQNDGGLKFSDVTNSVGLDENNSRFSFAVAWEDFDNDGDQDIMVANDYGRNCLYRNDGGRFNDIAPEMGVEDISSGMSVAWGDVNRDGWMDLYISNMFSSAGNRITYQRQFKPDVSEETKQIYQRMARGNSLFMNKAGQGFQDRSVESAVTLGRWAWGSRFVDLDNDGWEDIFVTNGFITTDDTGDL